MGDLHQQLLAATEPLIAGEVYSVTRLRGPLAALRAVVELHAPGLMYADEPDEPPVCTLHTIHCDDGGCVHAEDWPCATIRAVAGELGIEVTP